MKTLILLITIGMVTFAVNAQDRDRDQDRTQLREHLLYDDGTLYQVAGDQDRLQVRDRVRLNDGTVVNPDGTFQSRSGKQLRLKDGQCLDMEGNLYRNQNQFRREAQNRLEASTQEHLTLQNGQLYRVRNNQQSAANEQVRLHNGWAVNPDGTYQGKNGKQLQLRNGECLDMDGKRYQSEQHFRDRAAARARERSEIRRPEGGRIKTQRERSGRNGVQKRGS